MRPAPNPEPMPQRPVVLKQSSSRFLFTLGEHLHELGVGPLVSGLEENIKGIKKGETREFSMEVPAGPDSDEKKTFYYKATLLGLKEKHTPPLDDTAAARFGNDAPESTRGK